MSKFSFVDKKNIQNNNFFLDRNESHHLINVLRFKINSNIWLTDGEGGTYYCKVDNFTNKNIVEGSILEFHTNQNELNYYPLKKTVFLGFAQKKLFSAEGRRKIRRIFFSTVRLGGLD